MLFFLFCQKQFSSLTAMLCAWVRLQKKNRYCDTVVTISLLTKAKTSGNNIPQGFLATIQCVIYAIRFHTHFVYAPLLTPKSPADCLVFHKSNDNRQFGSAILRCGLPSAPCRVCAGRHNLLNFFQSMLSTYAVYIGPAFEFSVKPRCRFDTGTS